MGHDIRGVPVKQKRPQFQLPSPGDAWQGAHLAIENAERQLRCAEFLAVFEECGVAMGHLVIAAKEAIKSVVLLRHSLGLPVPPQELLALLHERRIRYGLATTHVPLLALVKQLDELVTALEQRFGDRSSAEYQLARDEGMREIVERFRHYDERDRSANDVIAALDFLGDADVRKNAAFYVDHENGRWTTPGDVSREQYAIAVRFVRHVVTEQREAIAHWASLAPRIGAAALQPFRDGEWRRPA